VGLCAATLLGAGIAASAIPELYARVETDLERTKFLIATTKAIPSGSPPAPEIVVLGNSVTMNGVDTELISNALPGGPIAYNFSSTGQSVSEGYLYLQELPDATRSVVLVVSPGNLEDDDLMPEDVANTFYMEGYRPTRETLDTLKDVFRDAKQPDKTAFLEKNEIQQRFQSRWTIAQAPDTEFRKRIRKDLDTSKSILSLTYPAPYTRPITAASFAKLLPNYNKDRDTELFVPRPTQVQLIRKMAAEGKAQGRNLFVILAPMHPERTSFLGPAWKRSRETWVHSRPFDDVPILDLTELLTADQYYDVVHPSRAGAEILSARIAEFLRGHLVLQAQTLRPPGGDR
jgi:hypothetical protein